MTDDPSSADCFEFFVKRFEQAKGSVLTMLIDHPADDLMNIGGGLFRQPVGHSTSYSGIRTAASGQECRDFTPQGVALSYQPGIK